MQQAGPRDVYYRLKGLRYYAIWKIGNRYNPGGGLEEMAKIHLKMSYLLLWTSKE